MKIEKINDTDYKIYYYRNIIDDKFLYNDIKELIKKIQKRLKLNGFYKVIAINKKVGLFIELKRLEDAFYKNTLDLKIEIKEDNVYYKTSDYFVIRNVSNIKYNDGMYYCIVDDSFDEIFEKVEFGEFIFGYDTIK